MAILLQEKIHVMQYAILSADSAESLEERVNKWMEIGFKPVGGLAVVSGAIPFHYCQAVLRDQWMTEEEAEKAKQRPE